MTDKIFFMPQAVLALVTLAAVGLVLLVPGSDSFKAELLLLIIGVAISLVLARFAPVIRIMRAPQVLLYAAPLLATALGAVLLAHVFRSDMGGLVTALTVAAATLTCVIDAPRAKLVATACSFLIGGLHCWLLTSDAANQKVSELVPLYVGDRVRGVLAPSEHGAPDIAVAQFGIDAAGTWGFGVLTPWNGLPGRDGHAIIPLPAVSDLSLIMSSMVFGFAVAAASVVLLTLAMSSMAERALIHVKTPFVSTSASFCAALGAYGLLTALFRSFWSISATVQTAFFSGVPAVFIGHAPAAAMTAMFAIGLLIPSQQQVKNHHE